MRRRVRPLAVFAVFVGATACAGPTAHVSLDGKSAPLEVAFGKPSTAVVPGNPPLAPVASGLGVVPVQQQPGVAVTYVNQPGRTVALPPLPTCPQASPFAAPKAVAANVITSAAPTGTFPYRFNGSATVGGKLRTFSGISQHTVASSVVSQPQPQQNVPGSYRFDITVPMLGATTTYTYAVVPGPGTAADVHGGIELVQVNGDGGYGYTASFHPDKPLQVFTQPAQNGSTWSDTTTDAQSASIATADGKVEGKDRVDACGTPLDSYLTTTVLQIQSPNETIKATVQTWWGTQFGGLPLAEVQSYSGTAGGVAVSGTITSIINVDPTAKPGAK